MAQPTEDFEASVNRVLRQARKALIEMDAEAGSLAITLYDAADEPITTNLREVSAVLYTLLRGMVSQLGLRLPPPEPAMSPVPPTQSKPAKDPMYR